jgi:hypothetical protein
MLGSNSGANLDRIVVNATVMRKYSRRWIIAEGVMAVNAVLGRETKSESLPELGRRES